MNRNKINDKDFYNLANAVAKILEENNKGKKLSKKQFTKKQKSQVERMMELECIFKDSINFYRQSDRIYHKFIIYTKIKKGNILTARPFFRETSKVFGKKISPAFKEEDIEKIKTFNINYKFMMFVLKNWKGNVPPRALKAWEEHQQVRGEIIENCMPLAINEAMKFYKAVPQNSAVTLMDMINASMAGLAIGVDKWVGPFRTVFRSVCIGRMKGNIMDLYNQTFLHYYPSDKKIIYKTNLLKSREKIEDNNILLDAINHYLKESGDNRKLEKYEFDSILNGTSMSAVESQQETDGFNDYDMYVDEESDTENKVEKIDTLKKVLMACENLNMMEKKIIRLKGVDL